MSVIDEKESAAEDCANREYPAEEGVGRSADREACKTLHYQEHAGQFFFSLLAVEEEIGNMESGPMAQLVKDAIDATSNFRHGVGTNPEFRIAVTKWVREKQITSCTRVSTRMLSVICRK